MSNDLARTALTAVVYVVSGLLAPIVLEYAGKKLGSTATAAWASVNRQRRGATQEDNEPRQHHQIHRLD